MQGEELFVVLSQEEAWELLSRCLNSSEQDNEVSRQVLRKLAKVLQCSQLELGIGPDRAA
jgi:hypothetical protein